MLVVADVVPLLKVVLVSVVMVLVILSLDDTGFDEEVVVSGLVDSVDLVVVP